MPRLIQDLPIINPAAVTAYPLYDDCTSLFILGGGADASCVNRSRGGHLAPATVHGSVLFKDGYAVFSGDSQTNFLQTVEQDADITDTETTLISVSRMPNTPFGVSTPGRGLFSNYNGTGNYGLSLHNTGALQAFAGGVDAAYFEESTRFSDPVFRFKAAIATQTEMAVYQRVDGRLVEYASAPVTRTINGDKPLRIGGDYFAGGYDDVAHVGLVARHRGAMTLERLRYVYDFCEWHFMENHRLRVW